MAPGLQEQGVGDDGADGSKCQCARDRVLRTMQQDSHQKAALCVDRDGSGAAPAAPDVVIP
jgi:hypothetical protein